MPIFGFTGVLGAYFGTFGDLLGKFLVFLGGGVFRGLYGPIFGFTGVFGAYFGTFGELLGIIWAFLGVFPHFLVVSLLLK